MKIHICNYYYSISEIVSNMALIFAKKKIGLSRDEIYIIKSDRKSVLECGKKILIRKDTSYAIDLAMCSAYSAKVADIFEYIYIRN